MFRQNSFSDYFILELTYILITKHHFAFMNRQGKRHILNNYISRLAFPYPDTIFRTVKGSRQCFIFIVFYDLSLFDLVLLGCEFLLLKSFLVLLFGLFFFFVIYEIEFIVSDINDLDIESGKILVRIIEYIFDIKFDLFNSIHFAFHL